MYTRWFDSSLFSCHFIVGDELLGQMVNSRAPEIATYLYMCLCMLFHGSYLNCLCTCSMFMLVIREQTGCIAATKLGGTVVILNSSKASGPFPNSMELYCIAGQCIKSFEAKGGSSKTSRTPLAFGPEKHLHIFNLQHQ